MFFVRVNLRRICKHKNHLLSNLINPSIHLLIRRSSKHRQHKNQTKNIQWQLTTGTVTVRLTKNCNLLSVCHWYGNITVAWCISPGNRTNSHKPNISRKKLVSFAVAGLWTWNLLPIFETQHWVSTCLGVSWRHTFFAKYWQDVLSTLELF